MRRIVVAVATVGALAAGTGTAMARDWHHPHPGPHGHHGPVGFPHHPRLHHHLSWWETLRLRLHHHH